MSKKNLDLTYIVLNSFPETVYYQDMNGELRYKSNDKEVR